jgi:hypothetical protein
MYAGRAREIEMIDQIDNQVAAIKAAVETVVTTCNGYHDRDCAWHSVMSVVENAIESGDPTPELVENALDIIDGACKCSR